MIADSFVIIIFIMQSPFNFIAGSTLLWIVDMFALNNYNLPLMMAISRFNLSEDIGMVPV